MPELLGALGSSLDFLERIGPSLVIDAARMAENLRAQPEVHVAGGTSKEGLRSALDELLKEIAR